MTNFKKSIAALLVIACMLVAALPASALYVAGETDLNVFFGDSLWSTNQVDGLAINDDGQLECTSVGGDPFFGYWTSIDAASVKEIEVRFSCENFATFQLFFLSDVTGGLSEANSFKTAVTADDADADGFVTLNIKTADCEGWQGNITLVRLDPTNKEGKIVVDYVKFLTDSLTVFSVDFSKGAPFNPNNCNKVFNANGTLIAYAKGSGRVDPYLNYNQELALNADSINAIHFKMKTTAKADQLKIYFTTDTIGWSEAASLSVKLSETKKDAHGWYDVEFDTKACAEWKGTITSFRLDPVEASGTTTYQNIYFDRATVAEQNAVAPAAAPTAVFQPVKAEVLPIPAILFRLIK